MNDYGISKLDGEKVVLEQNPDNVVLRIPILYGDVEYLDESAITTLFPKLKVARNPAKLGRSALLCCNMITQIGNCKNLEPTD